MGAFDGVFVDFYGTLVGGDRQAVEDVCQAVIDDYGLPANAAEIASRWGDRYFAAIESLDGQGFRLLREIEHDTLVDTFAMAGARIDATPYIAQLNAYMAQPALFDEVHEVLDRIRLPVCIVSNADEREIRMAIAHHGLRVDHIVTSEFARSYKPEARIFQAALEMTGWSADRVLHVGDSLHSDIGGAHNAGIKAAWVSRSDPIRDIGTEQPDFTWHDLRPLLAI